MTRPTSMSIKEISSGRTPVPVFQFTPGRCRYQNSQNNVSCSMGPVNFTHLTSSPAVRKKKTNFACLCVAYDQHRKLMVSNFKHVSYMCVELLNLRKWPTRNRSRQLIFRRHTSFSPEKCSWGTENHHWKFCEGISSILLSEAAMDEDDNYPPWNERSTWK